MLVTRGTQTPHNHEMTSTVISPLPLPQRKSCENSLSGERGQRRGHQISWGQLMPTGTPFKNLTLNYFLELSLGPELAFILLPIAIFSTLLQPAVTGISPSRAEAPLSSPGGWKSQGGLCCLSVWSERALPCCSRFWELPHSHPFFRQIPTCFDKRQIDNLGCQGRFFLLLSVLGDAL